LPRGSESNYKSDRFHVDYQVDENNRL